MNTNTNMMNYTNIMPYTNMNMNMNMNMNTSTNTNTNTTTYCCERYQICMESVRSTSSTQRGCLPHITMPCYIR